MAIETQLKSLLHIIRTVQRRKNVKLNELQDSLRENGFSHSKNTVKRGIDKLRELGFSLEYDDEHHTGYYLADNGDYTAHIENFLEAFELFTALDSIKGFSDFVYPETRRPSSIEHLKPLIEAIKKSQYVQFHYRKHSNRNEGFLITNPEHSKHIFESLNGEDESLRTVAPYVLKEFRKLWYLIGKDEDGIIKSFGFDRISEIKTLDKKFTKDSNFDIEKKYRDSFGMYTPNDGNRAEDIVLSFDAENGRYMKANPLHHSQKILVDTLEEFRIGLHIHITLDFLMEILTRTWSIRVISPDSLRESVCEIWEKALERNNKQLLMIKK